MNQHLRLDDAVMHVIYQPAESAQIDFAGDKPGYVDRSTGQFIECESLVCVLPFSYYLYVALLPYQKYGHFIVANQWEYGDFPRLFQPSSFNVELRYTDDQNEVIAIDHSEIGCL